MEGSSPSRLHGGLIRSLHAPAVIKPSYWTLKRLTILVGFLLTMLGSVGAYEYVEPVQNHSGSLDEDIKSLAAKIELMKNASGQYYMFEQQGSLIFAISAANTNEAANADISRLRQLALINQTFAVRELIGQLAMAGQLDYRKTSDAYQVLVDKARHDFTLENYLAVKNFEGSYMAGAEKQAGQLQLQRTNLLQQKAVVDREVDRRKLVMLVMTSLGSTFLLAANLIATREETSPKKVPDEEHGDGLHAGQPSR